MAACGLLALSIPPWGFWPLALGGCALLYEVTRGVGWRGRLGVGAAAGLSQFLIAIFWIASFNFIGLILLAALEGGFLALACTVTPPGRGRALAWPGALAGAEALRAIWPWGGFPMGGLALGQAASPLGPAARIGGDLLLLGLIGAAGVALAEAVRPGGRRAALAAGVAVVMAVAVGRIAPDGGPATGSLRVALVQGGGRRGLRAAQTDPAAVLDRQLSADETITGPVDLVVWPENVIDLDTPLAGSPEEAAVAAEARRLHTAIVAGVTTPEGDTRFHNQVVEWSAGGQMVASYEKRHRVPFGEYVPGRWLIRHVVDLVNVPRDAIVGRDRNVVPGPAAGTRLGVLISYEVFFAGRARAAVGHGAGALLVPTNAASYTTAAVPTEEVAAARLRALESGRDVAQAAPTGYSAVVDHDGRLFARSVLGHQQVLYGTLRLRRGSTIYQHLGDWPVFLSAAALLAAGWLRSGSRSGRRALRSAAPDGEQTATC